MFPPHAPLPNEALHSSRGDSLGPFTCERSPMALPPHSALRNDERILLICYLASLESLRMENTPMKMSASLSYDGVLDVVPTIPAEVYARPEPQASLYGESFPRVPLACMTLGRWRILPPTLVMRCAAQRLTDELAQPAASASVFPRLGKVNEGI